MQVDPNENDSAPRCSDPDSRFAATRTARFFDVAGEDSRVFVKVHGLQTGTAQTVLPQCRARRHQRLYGGRNVWPVCNTCYRSTSIAAVVAISGAAHA